MILSEMWGVMLLILLFLFTLYLFLILYKIKFVNISWVKYFTIMVGYRDVICYEEYLYDYNHIIAVVVSIHSNSPRYQCYKFVNLEFLNNNNKQNKKSKNPKIQKAITFTTFYAINIINTI
jgi:hypothetical protein